jgi:hypothetical protein
MVDYDHMPKRLPSMLLTLLQQNFLCFEATIRMQTKPAASRHASLGNLSDAGSPTARLRPAFITPTAVNRAPLPSLVTELPSSVKQMSQTEFVSSVPVFRRERFDLFGLNGTKKIM